MKALVLWADDHSANLGVRVLAHGAAALIRDVFPDAEVHFQDFGSPELGIKLTKKSLVFDRIHRDTSVREVVGDFDLIVDTGAGDSFADIYGAERMLVMTETQALCRRLGKPLVLMPQTIGPFDTRLGRWRSAKTLRSAAAVIARDATSRDYCARRGTTAVLSTDVVFALPQPRTDASAPTHDVVLNVSGLLWGASDHVDPDHYRSLIRDLIGKLREQDRNVTLLAHVLANPSADDDEAELNALAEAFEVEAIVPTDLWDAREVVSRSNVVLGSRMHACLNALSTGRPTVPLAYSRKFAPLMSGVGWAHGVDLREGPTVPEVLTALDRAESDDVALAHVRLRAEELLDEARNVLRAL
ncbi:polysaccharide pyruvyl transferase family protein [Nocardioides sp. TRM66260-LWL]|uniref:polysaccharide pyruvyl transferase family protein n=1 Tax=Nocardioides sp. TRM66260-LWL TaxID=2874478 RepID=UPI001CC68AA3|nr:polysaccharide pyruvyl transferase family protein [Nocardioides sp. TRM66260-LWL]MBZ5734935.1 polysaccharide pyruvyl transferase family protein [Nocardioides sp. TRM66260-LWL]